MRFLAEIIGRPPSGLLRGGGVLYFYRHNVDTIIRYTANNRVQRRHQNMDFLGSLGLALQAHWHCIVPVILIALVLLARNKGKKNQGDE
jgi:hypothetical protein